MPTGQHGSWLAQLPLEACALQIAVIFQPLTDKTLQDRVSEDIGPRQVSDVQAIGREGIGNRYRVAEQALYVHLGTFVFLIYVATVERCRQYNAAYCI